MSWLLPSGRWDDSGEWSDSDLWEDGILGLKKYQLVPTAAGVLDPLYADGHAPPTAPVLGSVTVDSPIQLTVPLQTPSAGGVAPLTYVLERSPTSSSAGFSAIVVDAFSPIEDAHEDTGLTASTQYWYRAYSFDSNTITRQSGYSASVTGTTAALSGDVTPPSTPFWVGSPVVTTTTIRLDWTAATDT